MQKPALFLLPFLVTGPVAANDMAPAMRTGCEVGRHARPSVASAAIPDHLRGDAAKFSETRPAGVRHVHVSWVGSDGRSRSVRSRVSVTPSHPVTGGFSGARTAGLVAEAWL